MRPCGHTSIIDFRFSISDKWQSAGSSRFLQSKIKNQKMRTLPLLLILPIFPALPLQCGTLMTGGNNSEAPTTSAKGVPP
jgi:hypothetical protein